jgi:hypothetical protein
MWDAPPNAILNDLAGAPFSVGKFAAYSDSNSDHGIIWVIFTQRLSADNLDPLASSKSKGGRGASSAFLYMSAGCDARVLHYSTCLSCTLLSIARSSNPGQVTRDRYIQQTLHICRNTALPCPYNLLLFRRRFLLRFLIGFFCRFLRFKFGELC